MGVSSIFWQMIHRYASQSLVAELATAESDNNRGNRDQEAKLGFKGERGQKELVIVRRDLRAG